eukprot:Stramenopile-MAST_4_protein_940
MGKLTLVRPSDLQESVAALIAGTDGSNRRKQLLASSSPTPLLHGIEEVRHLRKTGGAVLETLFDRITNMQHLNAAVPSTDKALHAPSTVSKQQNKIFAEIQKVQDLSESLDALNGSVRAAISAFQAQGKRKMDTEQRLLESNVESTTHTAVTEETSTVTEANTEKSEETKEQERKKNRRELRNIISLAQKKKILMTKEFDDIAVTREKTISEVEVAIADVLSNFDESVFVRDGVIDKLQSSVRGFDELVHHLLDKISTSEERISLIRSRLSETRKELENAKDTISAQSKLLRITREELEVVKAEMVRLKREMIDERAKWEELLAAAKRRESMLQSRLVELSRLYDALNDKMVELNKRAAREEELMKQLREERMKQGALLHWLQQRREQTKKKHAAMAIIRWLRLCLKRRKQSLPMTVRVKAKIPEPTTSISPPAKPTITADKANSMDDYHEYVRAKSVSPPHSPIKITAKLLSNDDSDDATRRYDTTLLSCFRTHEEVVTVAGDKKCHGHCLEHCTENTSGSRNCHDCVGEQQLVEDPKKKKMVKIEKSVDTKTKLRKKGKEPAGTGEDEKPIDKFPHKPCKFKDCSGECHAIKSTESATALCENSEFVEGDVLFQKWIGQEHKKLGKIKSIPSFGNIGFFQKPTSNNFQKNQRRGGRVK